MAEKTKQNHNHKNDAKISEVPTPKKKKLLQEVSTYQQIFQDMPLLCWYHDLATGTVRANEAAAAFDAATQPAPVVPAEVDLTVATPAAELETASTVTPDAMPTVADTSEAAEDAEIIISKQAKRGMVKPYQNSSGQAGWLRTDKVPHLDVNGNPIGLMVFATDITELQQTRELLAARNERIAKIEHALCTLLLEN